MQLLKTGTYSKQTNSELTITYQAFYFFLIKRSSCMTTNYTLQIERSRISDDICWGPGTWIFPEGTLKDIVDLFPLPPFQNLINSRKLDRFLA